jgi:hypothetical protein
MVGAGNFLFTTESRTSLGSTQPPIQWVPGALSVGIKCLGREADHLHPSSGAQLSTGTTLTFTFYLLPYLYRPTQYFRN